MSTAELLNQLSALGVKLWVDGTELGVSAPRGVLDAELQRRVRENREELLALLRRRRPAGAGGGAAPIRPAEPREALPLSFSQRRLWFLDQMESDSAVYNMPLAWVLRGPLRVEALEQALRTIHGRHAVLRTRFERRSGTPVQVVDARAELVLERVGALPGATVEERLEAVREALSERAAVPFDLAAGDLVRPTLFEVAPDVHVLLLLVHHIVFDGWSAENFLRELGVLYADFEAGRAPSLPAPDLQYGDYAVWQEAHVRSEAFASDLAHWKEALGADVPVLELPTDRPRPPIQTFHGANARQSVEPELLADLEALAKANGGTLYMALLAAYAVLLARTSGQRDLAVGTIVANRARPELEELMGFFANTLVLRLDLSGTPSFRELLGRVRAVALDAFDHQDTPFERLVEVLQPVRDLSRSPLFQTLFMTEDAAGRSARVGDLALELFELETSVARSDLLWTAKVGDAAPQIWAEYNTDLFDAATVEGMLRRYVTLLRAAVAAPERSVFELELLPAGEREQVLDAWNRTEQEFPEEPIHRQVERRARAAPEAPALVFPDLEDPSGAGDRTWTYAALDADANRLAHELLARGVRPGELVGLCLERSGEMVVAQLAIQKAGCAYVPLDPTYPVDRLAYMAEDAGLAWIVTTTDQAERLPAGPRRVELDADAGAIAARPADAPDVETGAHERMYVIYTSGSTGRPKGVELEHRSVSNFLASMAHEPGFAAGERLLAVTTLSFDISVLETMLPLVTGGTVVVAPALATADGQRLAALLERLRPDVMQATPATWRMLMLSGWEGTPGLRVFCGGEALPRELADALLPRCAALWNLYGPTEATIWSTVRRIGAGEALCPIGHPIANTRLYVLDDALQPQPVGVPGELWIAGAGLARGYLGRPELTAERFRPDPFRSSEADGSPARMYRTGDAARWLPSGELDCLGRIDHQVKLRGFRIELQEIEAVLCEFPGVRQCVCALREDTPGDQRLQAYFLTDPGTSVDVGALRATAREKLPVYMVPSAFVRLDAFPHTPNGKVDRKAIAAMRGLERAPSTEYVAPRNELERAIAEVWSDVLKMERVPVNENFFDLGGHSLLLAEAHAKLQERLDDAQLTIVELFQYPTVASLAEHEARRSGRGSADREEPGPRSGPSRSTAVTGGAPTPAREYAMEDIAIVGMAGRFPGAGDVDAFWQNLRDGVESIRTFSDDELLAAGVDPRQVADPNYVNCWGYLEDVDLFDAAFFEMTPREAEAMDPQIRLLLETSWQLLEKAGCDPTRPKGPIGVFAGASINLYLWENVLTNPSVVESLGDIQVLLGNDKDFIATTVAYKLDLKGPALTVQTACSTSLVASHMACQSLQTGESYLALAGGVSAPVREKHGYLYKEGGTFSQDGHVRAFDARAKGMLGGYGVGLVALKLLRNALADGDTIHAVIKGSALNNDGSDKVSFTAPSVDGQTKVILEALDAAGVDPATISYVECHGTGTPLGDPIEIKALTQAWRRFTDERGWCPIGSVKTNIGHLDIAAGVSGLIKTACSLSAREIAPSLNFETPNPELDLPSTPFFVNTELRPWDTDRLPRRATVSSLGMGGTNAHMVLEEAPEPTPTSASRPHQLLLFSGRSKPSLEAGMRAFGAHLAAHPEQDLADAAFTLQVGRKGFRERCFAVVEDREDALAVLERLDKKRSGTGRVTRGGRPVAFLFSGQGAQHANMLRGLYESEPTFRASIDRSCELLEPHLGHDLRASLFPTPGDEEQADEVLKLTQNTQPALFAVELALAELWMEWGIEPAGMIGHSIGEYVAAHLAGVFSLEDALALVCARGALIGELPAGGQMMAVHLAEEELVALLAKAGDGLSLAAVNAPGLCVVSGSVEALDRLQSALSYQEVPTRLLQTSHAFHSSLLDPVLERFRATVEGVTLHAPTRPFVSCKTGTWIRAEEATDPGYWVAHMREAVRFHQSVRTLVAEADPILLEVGPGQTLTTLARLCVDGPGTQVVPSARHPKESADDQAVLLHGLGQLWAAGADVDWDGFYRRETRRRIPLHTYAFERQRYYITPSDARPRVSAGPEADGAAHAVPERKTDDPARWFYVPSWRQAGPPAPRADAPADAPAPGWLLFLDERGLGEALAARAREAGHAVATVRAGDGFAQADGAFTIDPRSAEDYARVLGALPAAPERVVHLFAVDAVDTATPTGREAALDRSFYSLLHLGQALSAAPADGLRVAAVHTGVHDVLGDEPPCPEKATLLGPCKALRFELPQEAGATCTSIGVPQGDDLGARLAERLFREIDSGAQEPWVAYHGKHRWTLDYAPAVLPGVDEVPHLERGGTYLVTGGLGGIGLCFAEFLARSQGANLVLLGRSELPAPADRAAWIEAHGEADPTSAKLLAIRKLESLGAEVLALAADVTDAGRMAAVVAEARQRFGRVHGVFHCAGVLGSGLLEMKTREEAARVLAPKVAGTQVLLDLFADEPLDLLVLFSSISTATGVLAGVDYSAANSYLDALAQRGAGTPGTHVVAIDWDTWSEVGMAMQGEVPEHLRERHRESLELAVSPEEGVEALRRALAADLAQVYVTGLDLTQRDDLAARRAAAAAAGAAGTEEGEAGAAVEDDAARSVYARPSLSTEYVEPRTETEGALAAIWADLLGIDKVGAEDDFFELGGNSLVMMQLNVRLRSLYGVSLPIRQLFELPKVELLAEQIDTIQAAASFGGGAGDAPADEADVEEFTL